MSSRVELRDGVLHYLLTLTIGEREYRFSYDSVEVVDQVGGVRYYGPGLGRLDFREELALNDSAAIDRSVSLEVTFPGAAASGWQALSHKRHLGGVRAELALWLEGSTWREREVLIEGFVDRPIYGRPGAAVKFSILEVPALAGVMFPPAEHVCSALTWPRAASVGVRMGEGAEEEVYPQVFGEPGLLREGASGTLPLRGYGVVVVEVDDGTYGSDGTNANHPATILIAGHDCACVGVVDSVILYNVDSGNDNTFTPYLDTDLAGHPVTLIDVPVAALPLDEGSELYVSFLIADKGGRKKIRAPRFGDSARGAGELLEFFLSLHADFVRVDRAGVAALRATLDAYHFDFVINEPVELWGWLTDNLLSLLPVAPAWSSSGLYLASLLVDATAADAVATLDTSAAGVWLVTEQVGRTSANDVRNYLEISFGIDRESGRYLKRAAYGPVADGVADPNLLCAISAREYPDRRGFPTPRRAEIIETDLVLEDSTAWAILRWRILELAFTRRDAEVRAPQEYAGIESGQAVILIAAEVGITGWLMRVTGRTRAPGPVTFHLEELVNPIRDMGGP